VAASFPIAVPSSYSKGADVCCSQLVKAECCSAAKAGCCKEGAKAIPAANATDAGCCKGSGKRADGKACCGKCPADKTAKATPVASRAD